jgi:ATP-dependent Lhr-like helicase
MGATNADYILKMFDEIKNWSNTVIQNRLTAAAVKTGIFKRRIIHVARRFGALKKWVDFSSVSLRHLIKSFEKTAIYDEALKEIFTKDLDIQHTIQVLNMIGKGEIEVKKLETGGIVTPIARVGLERVSMKTDIIPPERMKLILVESAKARLFNEVRTFICTNCWDYLEMICIKDLPNKPECPKCGATALGVLRQEEDEAISLIEKKGERLTKNEKKWQEQALETAQLMAKYGKSAAAALSGRRLRTSDVKEILQKDSTFTDHFFELVIEAEKKALKRRFW